MQIKKIVVELAFAGLVCAHPLPVSGATSESIVEAPLAGREESGGYLALEGIPGSQRYLPAELIPQRVRSYADDQPVLENPWITVPRAAGFKSQDEYLLSVYPSLKTLPEAERAAALRGVKRTLTPILEKSADGRDNPVYAELRETVGSLNLKKMNEAHLLADLYFHAQSPLRDATPEVREEIFQKMMEIAFQGVDPKSIDPVGEGNKSWGGEYMLYKILRPYLMLEIFNPEALTMDQRRTLNRVLMHPFFGFNGQLGMVGFTQDLMSGILNKQVFTYNALLVATSLMELQMARYPESENLWPGFSRDLPEFFRDTQVEIAQNYHNGLMGDGATRYVPGYTHAYFYEGPQMEQLMRNWFNTYDESDPALMRANNVLWDRILAIGNYYEQAAVRVVENDEDSHHTISRAQFSEAKSFGNELVNRGSDPIIFWELANLTGNRWLRQSGPALQAQRMIENPKVGLTLFGVDLPLASAWNPEVRIGPDETAGTDVTPEPGEGGGFRQNYLLWDRNNLGATGKFDNWAFHFVGRGLLGRRPAPDAEVSPLFEKDSFAGFIARSAGSPPTETGLRTDHRLAHMPFVGIFPEKTRLWGSVKNANPKLSGVGPGYAPHWEAAQWSATVTDGFAVQTSSARANATDAVCREVWLATPNGAVGLLSGDVSEDPKNGDGYARLSFLLQGFFGTRIRSYRQPDGFQVDPVPSPITFPTITPEGNGFDFVNLRVRVLEQNFTDGPIFAHLKTGEDFYPVDKRSPEMRGLDDRAYADNESHGAVTREVQVRGQFLDGKKPMAVVAVHTGDQKTPLTGQRIASLPGVEGEPLVVQAKDADADYLVIYNPGKEPLNLGGWQVSDPEARVRAFRSGARYRPEFLGNIEVNPEADKEDEVVYGSVIQEPPVVSMREAIREQIPPGGHLVLVGGGKEFKTGGPGFEVRPTFAEWRFRPENREGIATRELTGRCPALKGGELAEADAVRLDGSGALTGNAIAMPTAGTIRFWVKPEALAATAPTLLFASGGSADWELWADQGSLVMRHAADGKEAIQRFAGGLENGVWQQVVASYASADPATWSLRVNDALRAAESGKVELAAPAKELRVGEGLTGSFKDLAIHDAVLTPGEINFVHDREQPANFNRIRVAATPSHVWVNGNRINETSLEELVDSDKIARHLKPGVNVIGIEMAGTPLNAKGRKDPSIQSGFGVWIRGRNLTAADSPFLSGWQTILTRRDAVGSRLLAAYDAQIKRQLEHLDSQGRSAKEYRNPDWRPIAYDRPWLAGKDTLSWQQVAWAPASDEGEQIPQVDAGDGLRLYRFTFMLDDRGVPQPFTP